jgi:hypothetical protein
LFDKRWAEEDEDEKKEEDVSGKSMGMTMV